MVKDNKPLNLVCEASNIILNDIEQEIGLVPCLQQENKYNTELSNIEIHGILSILNISVYLKDNLFLRLAKKKIGTLIHICILIYNLNIMRLYIKKKNFSILGTIIFSIIFCGALSVNAQWVAQTSGVSYDLKSAIFIDSNTGWVVGENGTIIKTVDGGSTWTSQTTSTTSNLNGVSFISSTTGYAAGEMFRNMKTTDGGTSWTSWNFSTNKNVNSIQTLSSSRVVGVGENIVFYTSSSFTNYITYGSYGVQNCLFYVNSTTGWMVGNSGSIYKLSGAIYSFTSQTSGTTEDLLGVHFVSTTVGYVVGKNGTILKTTNGGTSWTSLMSGISVDLNSVFFTDADTGYAVGENETILKTTDGGNSWTIQMSGTNTLQHHRFVWFTDANNGWIVGTNGTIYHTSNGGEASVGMASKPFGPHSRCETPAIYTASAVNATSYIWTLHPASSGTITGSGTEASVTWNSSYNANSTITVQGIDGTEHGSVSNPLIVYGNPAAFSLLSPQNGAWISATPLFEWTTSDGANSYSLYIDDILIKENITSTDYQLLQEEAISSGMHTWYVMASNGCTTQSNETRSFFVDDTPPSSFNLSSPSDNSWTTNLQPTFEWDASGDAQSGLNKYQLWIDGELNRDDIPASASLTMPISALTNGSHVWEIWAVDNVGNIRESTQSRIINIDNVPPGNIDNCAFFDGSNDYAESTNGVMIANEITMEAWIRPKCGNYTDRGILDTGPTYFSIDDNNFLKYKYYQGYNQWSGNFLSNSSLPCNTWTHVTVTHNSITGIVKIYINGELDATHADCYAVIDGASLFTIGKAMPNGGYGWRYFYGNIDEARIWNTVRNDNEIQQNMNKVLEGTCQSNLLAYFSMNDSYYSTILEDGSTNNNDANLINGASIEKSSKENDVLGGLSDLKVPECAEYVQTIKPSFYWCKAPDEGVGFEKFQLFIDNNLVEDNLSDSSVAITSPLAYGEHNWFVKGFDSLGNNQPSYKRTFYVDNARPNPFSLLIPADSQIVNLPTPDMSWEAAVDSAGGSGMSKYQLWISGETDIDSIPVGTTTTSPSSVLPQGEYSWFIKAYDNVGNVRQSTETRTFYVDWEPPTDFSLIEPIDNETVSTSRPSFKWEQSYDIGSGIDKYELNISGQTPIEIPSTDTSYTITFDLPNGNYTWFVKAYDLANAFTSSNIHNLIVDVPLPGQAAAPTGESELFINAPDTDYTTAGATNATSYIWEISPDSAGVITGTGLTATVDWDNTFIGTAEISVKGENQAGVGDVSDALIVTIYPAVEVDLNLSFGEGYTWFSENLAPEDAHPNAIFEGLAACNNDRLIGQSNFSVYYNGSWNGTITAMNPFHSYRMKLCEAQEYTATAPPAEITPIPLNAGYTWLGYLPQGCLPSNEALANITPPPTANDRLIGQSSFALFTGTAWIGSLTTLCPGEGYVIKLATASELTYPEATVNGAMNKHTDTEADSPIGVMPEKNLQHSMTVLGQIELASGQYSVNANDRIYAFVNDQCVGMANPMEAANGIVFLSIGENSDEPQEVTFKIWLDEQQQLYQANETMTFVPLKGEGVFDSPFKFTLGNPVVDQDDWFVGEPYPNPFSEEAVVPMHLKEPAKVNLKLYDVAGQVVLSTEKAFITAGKQEFHLKKEALKAGVYTLNIQILNNELVLSKSHLLIIY